MLQPSSPERLPKVQDNKQYVLDDPVQEKNTESDPHVSIPELHPPDMRNMKDLKKMTSFIYQPHKKAVRHKRMINECLDKIPGKKSIHCSRPSASGAIQTGYTFKCTFAGTQAFEKAPVYKPSGSKQDTCRKPNIEQSSVTDRFKKPFP